jgi:hypothetical protein
MMDVVIETYKVYRHDQHSHVPPDVSRAMTPSFE